MLTFFTDPYPDELLYSAFARYHFYSGNIDKKSTLSELFGVEQLNANIGFGNYLKNFVSNIGSTYSVENLLEKHTIYPYHSPFITKDKQEDILDSIRNTEESINLKLGINTGSISKKNTLYYCSLCAVSDIEKYGEPIIHREHHLQGIDYCPHHELRLTKYPIQNAYKSKIEFIRFEERLMDLSVKKSVDENKFKYIEMKISKMAYQLLKLPFHTLSLERVHLKYRAILRNKGFITAQHRVRQEPLCLEFLEKLPNEFLMKFNSSIQGDLNEHWLKNIVRPCKNQIMNPFRYLLFLYFLDQDIASFMQIDIDKGPFGEGPWPCWNIKCTNYGKRVISKVALRSGGSKVRETGIFSCECGFIYSSKNPNVTKESIHILSYGDLWLKALLELRNKGYTKTAIAKELNVHIQTVIKYLEYEKIDSEPLEKRDEINKYRKEMLIVIRDNPRYSRTDLLNKHYKCYRYLLKNDRKWLEGVLPAKRTRQISFKRVDWGKRDREFCNLIKDEYNRLGSLETPVRVTTSLIGNNLGISEFLHIRRIDKLPLTKELLRTIVETVPEFQLRKCYKIIDDMVIKGEIITLSKVKELAVIRHEHFKKIKLYVEEYLSKSKVNKG